MIYAIKYRVGEEKEIPALVWPLNAATSLVSVVLPGPSPPTKLSSVNSLKIFGVDIQSEDDFLIQLYYILWYLSASY